MPVDFIVATYVYHDRKRILLYVALAAFASALGSVPLYLIGYLEGRRFCRKRISEERFLKIHRSFERHEFWALMFPGMLPPPLPFKVFVLAAAVFEMRFRDFLIAIFLGTVCSILYSIRAGALLRTADRGPDWKDFQAALDTSFKRDRRDSLFGDLCVLDQKNETGEHGELTSLRQRETKRQGRGRSHAL